MQVGPGAREIERERDDSGRHNRGAASLNRGAIPRGNIRSATVRAQTALNWRVAPRASINIYRPASAFRAERVLSRFRAPAFLIRKPAYRGVCGIAARDAPLPSSRAPLARAFRGPRRFLKFFRLS
jgi:hypothetical protein